MTTYLFPGQGSQTKGMGAGLFEKFPKLVATADAILGYSIRDLCEKDSKDQLNKTEFTQPALYVVNALTFYSQTKNLSENPRFLAGHSLGEYSALLAANVFDFETGLKIVKKRGELMSQAKGGAMIAVLGLKVEPIKEVLAACGLQETVFIANENTFTQTVISGLSDAIQKAHAALKEAGALIITLPVSGAFHSRYLNDASSAFKTYLENFTFATPDTEIISNYTALPYESQNIKNFLALQMTHTVRWVDSMLYLLKANEDTFLEMGPGNILFKMVMRIKKGQ